MDEKLESKSPGNSEGDDQQNADEPVESAQASGRKDEPVVCEDVLYEAEQDDDEIYIVDDEPASPLERGESNTAKEYEVISLSSDEDELPPTTSTSNAMTKNLKTVYGVTHTTELI